MPLTIGQHLCKVVAPSAGWFAESAKKGTPFLRIPIQITEGPAKGECHIYQAWLTDNTYTRTIENLTEVFGPFDLEELARLVDSGPWVGKPCSIAVEEEPDQNGQPRLKIAWLNSASGAGGGKIMAANAALQLARRLINKPAADTGPAGPPPERRLGSRRAPEDIEHSGERGTAESLDDLKSLDDIPF